MKKFAFAMLIGIMALCGSAFIAEAAEYSTGEALVVFRAPEDAVVTAAALADKEDGLSVSIAAAVTSVGAEAVETYEALSEADGKIFVLVKSATKSTEELIAALKQRPDVIAASPNWVCRLPPGRSDSSTVSIAAETTPNDPDYSQLWGMKKIRAPEAWATSQGSETVYVAVMDSGVYGQHPDLKDNIAAEFGFSAGGGVWSEDLNGHGTHVSGTIGAIGNNGIGVAGVNWRVKIIPVGLAGAEGQLEGSSSIISGLNYLTALLLDNPDMKLAAVNMSFNVYYDMNPERVQGEADYMAFRAFDRLNRALMVVAAGNEGLEVGVPAPFEEPMLFQMANESGEPKFTEGQYCYPASFTGLNNFLVVGAMASDDSAGSFSNWGQSVDIAAPGDDIWSTYSPLSSGSEGTFYETLGGTSMAAPHVTGAAALLLSAYPDATPAQLKKALLDGANSGVNPKAYPYKTLLENQRQELDKMYKAGEIAEENYVAAISLLSQMQEAYEPLQGAGTVSRIGLLNLKGALDVLSASVSRKSSSSGCDMGFVALGFAGLLPAIIIRRRAR